MGKFITVQNISIPVVMVLALAIGAVGGGRYLGTNEASFSHLSGQISELKTSWELQSEKTSKKLDALEDWSIRAESTMEHLGRDYKSMTDTVASQSQDLRDAIKEIASLRLQAGMLERTAEGDRKRIGMLETKQVNDRAKIAGLEKSNAP